jgi:protein-disulfide isomerase
MSQPEPPGTGVSGARIGLDLVASVFMICAAAAILWSVFRGPEPAVGVRSGNAEIPIPAEPLAVSDAPILGDPNAPVGMIVFSDFECPFCGRFAQETLPELQARYIDPGQMFLVFRHLPLPIHAQARPAAEASECAARQGKFWEYHDALFAAGPSLAGMDWARTAQAVDLRTEEFTACAAGEAAQRYARSRRERWAFARLERDEA